MQAGPRAACSTIAPMDPRPRASERTPAQALSAVVVALGMLAYYLFMAGPLMADLFKGVPPIEQLRRVDGRLQSWRDCHRVGRRSEGEDVTLVGDAGSVSVAIPCVLHGKILADGKPHRMTVLLQDTKSVGSLAYDIELDGRKLLAYADEKRIRAGADRFALLMLGVVLVMLLVLVAAAVKAFWRTWRGADEEDWHAPRGEAEPAPPAQSRTDQRAAALAMLAEGNSAHAVASVFGVPEAQVVQWAGEPRVRVAAAAPARHRLTSFDATLVYESPLWGRLAIGVLCLVSVSIMVPGLALKLRDGQGALEIVLDLSMVAVIALSTTIAYRMSRVRLIFGPHEVRSYGVFGSQALAYGEVGGFTLEPDRMSLGRGGYVEGSRLTIVGTGDRPALSTFIYRSRPLDPRILERLRELVGPRVH
jgi:hypothetical protein